MSEYSALKDKIKALMKIKEGDESYDDFLNEAIPVIFQIAEEKTKKSFDKEDPPGGVILFVFETVKHIQKNQGNITSRSLGEVSVSYRKFIPEEAYALLPGGCGFH